MKAELADKKMAVSGAANALEIADKQVVTRKRPAEGEILDEGTLMTATVPRHPSKRVKGNSNGTRNKPQPLRHTGLFLHIQLEIRH